MNKEEELFNNGEIKIYCTKCKKVTKHTEYLDAPGQYLKGVVCNECKTNKQQLSPPYYSLYEYTEKCECGNEITLLTQNDTCPEYHTDVRCVCPKCGELILFVLPVN